VVPDEYIVVHSISDRATDYTDGEGEGCDGGDEVVGADDGGYQIQSTKRRKVSGAGTY